jgi:hypothetical protein
VTWPLPEADDGEEDGELKPLDDELLELFELLDVPELPDVPLPLELLEPPDVAWCELLGADPDDALAAPGRLNATAPAAIRLVAVAETVAARNRARPRSLAATADCMLGGVLLRAEVLCLLMSASLPACFPAAL